MTDKTQAMDRLIKRLYALDAPCRECDKHIHLSRGYRQELPTEPSRYPDDARWIRPDGKSCGWLASDDLEYPPRYTASIDAAMTLAGKTDAEAISVLMEAIDTLECEGWPKGDWLKHLPRFICWAALCTKEASHDGR